jgi:hypothetical protein
MFFVNINFAVVLTYIPVSRVYRYELPIEFRCYDANVHGIVNVLCG